MIRLDVFLFQNNYFSSREKAHDAILQKTISVNGCIVSKPAFLINETATNQINIIDIYNIYVSRGGLKLKKAISDFNLDFNQKKVLDVGASTGGFTDCALQHGAEWVAAIDVGTAQLHPNIRQNPNVLSIENCDFRNLTLSDVNHQTFDFIVSDVSFISLSYLFPFFSPFLAPNGALVLLVKPQFEVGQSFLGRSGIVKDFAAYKIAIQRVVKSALNEGFFLQNISLSTIYEKNKNVEFLALFSKNPSSFMVDYPALFEEIKIKKNKL